jgi:hypothetical protein
MHGLHESYAMSYDEASSCQHAVGAWRGDIGGHQVVAQQGVSHAVQDLADRDLQALCIHIPPTS